MCYSNFRCVYVTFTIVKVTNCAEWWIQYYHISDTIQNWSILANAEDFKSLIYNHVDNKIFSTDILFLNHNGCKWVSAAQTSSQSSASVGCWPTDQSQEPRSCFHDHWEGWRDLADFEVDHIQSNIAARICGKCQCSGGKPGQKFQGKNDCSR